MPGKDWKMLILALGNMKFLSLKGFGVARWGFTFLVILNYLFGADMKGLEVQIYVG